MENLSLQQVMNNIARGDSLPYAPSSSKKASNAVIPEILTELDAFICIDPLLKHLHQQYLDAKKDRLSLVKAHGANDPMVEIAIDMEDSAWCAMQTCYLELRENRRLMQLAQALIKDSEYAHEKALEQRQKEKALQLFYFFQMLEKIRQEKEEVPNLFEIWVVLIILQADPVSIMKRQHEVNSRQILAA